MGQCLPEDEEERKVIHLFFFFFFFSLLHRTKTCLPRQKSPVQTKFAGQLQLKGTGVQVAIEGQGLMEQ
jgi:hypothetical protein